MGKDTQGLAPAGVDAPRPASSRWIIVVALVMPAAMTALVLLLGVDDRALWADEAYTALASTLSWHDLLVLTTQSNDAVHGLYYASMKPVLEIFGVSEWSLRLPSVAFMVMACLAVTLIAKTLLGLRGALLTGVSFALLPIVADYGTEARSYALSVALVSWTTWVFVRLLVQRRDSRFGWAAYWWLLTLTGLVFMYAWLIALAHGATLLVNRSLRRSTRAMALAAIGLSALVLAPFWLLAVRQSGQVGWITRDTVAELESVASLVFDRSTSTPWWAFTGFWLIAGWGTAHVVRTTGAGSPGRLLASVAWPWALGPGLVLVAASLVKPTFTDRYLAFTAPAVALLIGLALSYMTRLWTAVSLVTLVTVGALSYQWVFVPGGRDNWGVKYQILRTQAGPGDGVVFSPAAYGNVARFTGLPDGLRALSLVEDGDPSTQDLRGARLRPARVWLVPFGCVLPEDQQAIGQEGYVLDSSSTPSTCAVQEYVLSDAVGSAAPAP